MDKASATIAALPGGNGNPDGSFANAGNNGNWWSATASVAGEAYRRNMNRSNSYVNRNSNSLAYRFSARCVQDCYGGNPGCRVPLLFLIASDWRPCRHDINYPQ